MAQVDQYSEKLVPNVHETERDAAPSPPPTMQKPRRFWEKLGLYNMAVLVLGTVAVAIALAFLFFIWGASTHGRRNSFPELWMDIVERKWATRVVTLSSVLIRIATAAQLGVFAAILAALILERVGVATEDLPLVSMIRCLNSGPHSLALSVANSFFTKALYPYSLLIVLAILNAFALQFTSTVLLTDFGDDNIVMASTNSSIQFGLIRDVRTTTTPESKNVYGGLDYWKTPPFSYQRFAEFKENGTRNDNYVDTGRTIRGFPPHNFSSERWNLREYDGPMTLVDARVVCVKPTVSNLSFYADDGMYATTMKAAFHWNSTVPGLEANNANGGTSSEINCTIPFADNYNVAKEWQTSLCTNFVQNAGRLVGGIQGNDSNKQYPNGLTSTVVLLNATGSADDWANAFTNKTQLERTETSKPLWTDYKTSNVSLGFTLCFINPLPATYQVEASSKHDFPDEIIYWEPESNTFNTTGLRYMYGVTDNYATIEDRGQLQLKAKANWNDSRAEKVWKIDTLQFIWDTLLRFDYQMIHTSDADYDPMAGETSMFSSFALPDYSVHRSHAIVFQDIIQKTRNPALALQTIYTILLQMAYYDFLNEYDVSAPARYQVSRVLNIPTQWKAFGIILGLIVVHFTLVITALRLFLARTEMSLLGNAWQAVSQVVSADTADVLHHGATTTDREVKGTMKQSGVADSRVRIAKCTTSGRIEATAVRQRHGATYTAPVGQV